MKGKWEPMRVRKPLSQHAVQMLSAEKEEDTDLLHSVKPLPPLPTSTGQLIAFHFPHPTLFDLSYVCILSNFFCNHRLRSPADPPNFDKEVCLLK